MCLGDIFETESLFLEPKKKQQAVIFFSDGNDERDIF